MKKSKEKKSSGDILAERFQKTYGEIVYSGTLAIETALLAAGVKSGDYVILPNDACYRVLLSIIRIKATPIIVSAQNGLVLTVEDIRSLSKRYKIKAIILVHSLGIPVNVRSFRGLLPKDTVIIEDAAQAWGLKYAGSPVGSYSDYVVTSFGKTKPLSLGLGGALFSNNGSFKRYLDYTDKPSRHSADVILPYVMPRTFNIDIDKLIFGGNLNAKKSISAANLLTVGLKLPGIRIWDLGDGDVANWYRFPIFVGSKKVYEKVISLAQQHHLIYKLPHRLELSKIPLALKYNSRIINNRTSIEYRIDLGTSENKIKNIKSWLRELKKELK